MSASASVFDSAQWIALRRLASEIVILPDKSHWILKPRNFVAWNAARPQFFGRHLGQAAYES